jgi:hypothetical protein
MTTPTALPLGVVRAPPLWALDAEANARHMALVRHRAEAEAIVTDLVTKHPAPYFDDPVTSSARELERLAERVGMVTRMHVGLEGCTLEGRLGDERIGFSASWRRGRADVALWYEPEWRWGMTHDTRPGPDAKVERRVKGKVKLIADPKRMPKGLGRDHVVMLESPLGVPVSFATLTARVKAMTVGT